MYDLIPIAFVLLILCTTDYFYFPTLLATVAFLRFYLTPTFNDIVSYVVGNPMDTVLYTGIYFTVGTLWTYIKWNVYVSDYKKTHESLSVSHKDFVLNKISDIYIWWMFWPLNIISSLLGDYLYRFFKYFFEHFLMGLFTNVVKSAFGDEKKNA